MDHLELPSVVLRRALELDGLRVLSRQGLVLVGLPLVDLRVAAELAPAVIPAPLREAGAVADLALGLELPRGRLQRLQGINSSVSSPGRRQCWGYLRFLLFLKALWRRGSGPGSTSVGHCPVPLGGRVAGQGTCILRRVELGRSHTAWSLVSTIVLVRGSGSLRVRV